MMMIRVWTWLIILLLAPWAQAGIPLPERADRIRIAEAFHLADSVQDEVWPGWSEVPFVLLLVTEDHEYLYRHPFPSGDFQNLGMDPITGEVVFARANTGAYSLGFLATFPAVNGVNTVVIGQADNTGKSSTLWAITALHEHFHQLQFTRPWYNDAVNGLDLSGGDTSGMWQLSYPFPYDSQAVEKGFERLLFALQAGPGSPCDYPGYAEAMGQIRDSLTAADYRYLAFQLWQEGAARYTEYAVAKAAAASHAPLAEFRDLADFIPYAEAFQHLIKQQENELDKLTLRAWMRVAFYPIGAAIGLMQDACSPGWKTRYFEPPYFGQYLETRD